jgi:hypothetical protein
MKKVVQCRPRLVRSGSNSALPALRRRSASLSRLSSNRAVECKPFLMQRLSFARSSVVFAVNIVAPHDGASRVNLPRCETHAPGMVARRCNSLVGMVRRRPGRDASARLRAGAYGFFLGQAVALTARLNRSPDFSIACMMTANLRATATAARLKPILSRSFSPHLRRSLSAWVRVRITVAAS